MEAETAVIRVSKFENFILLRQFVFELERFKPRLALSFLVWKPISRDRLPLKFTKWLFYAFSSKF